ncbi:hypothetical protein PGB90_002784 [Kerria lacca]
MKNCFYILMSIIFICVGSILFSLLTRKTFTMVYEDGTHSIAYVTAPNEEVAKNIAKYKWENKINEDPELLMMIKTRTSKIPNLINYVKSVHPYKVCEIISVPIQNGNTDYLNWISSEVPNNTDL